MTGSIKNGEGACGYAEGSRIFVLIISFQQEIVFITNGGRDRAHRTPGNPKSGCQIPPEGAQHASGHIKTIRNMNSFQQLSQMPAIYTTNATLEQPARVAMAMCCCCCPCCC